MSVIKRVLVFVLIVLKIALTTVAQVPDHKDFDIVFKPLSQNPPTWTAIFNVGAESSGFNLTMTQSQVVNLTITYIDPAWKDDFSLHVIAEDPKVLGINKVITSKDIQQNEHSWSGNFTIDAILLGHTSIYVELRRPNIVTERSQQTLDVIVLRNEGTMDIVFKSCVGIFVMVIYINFGAVLDLNELKRIVIRPVGPAIGLVGQFLFMPVLSFLIGYIMFRDMFELRLGLFFTGSTPGGGASNIFTVILGGNLNLSITMTALSNLAAFGMMPLWIFTLGALIFHDGNFAIPYQTIAFMSFSLVLPLSIGIALQKFAPKVAKIMSKLLKPVSLVMIIFITIFAFTVNSYMFKLFSWKIIIASSALPWIGYLVGWLFATILRQSPKDALTIAIETGIQNVGIAIFMLNFTLPQPQADMTSAVPVANSMMTPLPLLAIYFIRKCFCRTSIEQVEEAPTKELKEIEIETIMEKNSASVDTKNSSAIVK